MDQIAEGQHIPYSHADAGGGIGGLFVPNPHHQRRKQAGSSNGEGPGHQEQNIRPGIARSPGRGHRHNQQQHARDDKPARGGRISVNHLVVDVMRQRIGESEQQTIGGRKRRGQATRSHQTRDHIGQARDFRCGKHHNVRVNAEFIPLQNAIAVDVHNVDPRHPIGRHDLPILHPIR